MIENTTAAVESIEAPAPRRASFIAPRKELLAALRGLKHSAPRIGTPERRGVKLGINGVVELRAENGEQSARFVTEWDRDGATDVAIDTQAAINFLSASKAESVRVAVDGESVRMMAGHAETALNCVPGEHIAPLPITRELFAVNVAELRRAVGMTEWAADVECARYALGGICVEFRKLGEAVFVATDGRRLSAVAVPAEWAMAAGEIVGDASWDATAKAFRPAGVVLPVKFWETLLKLAPKTGIVRFSVADRPEPTTHNAPRFTRFYAAMVDGVRVETLPLEGRFPRWRDVVPSESSANWRAEFDAKEMAAACKMAAGGTDEENRGVDFIPQDGIGFKLKALNAAAFCPATFGAFGKPMPATYDPRFIGQFCAAVGKGRIVARVVDAETPIVMEFDRAVYVVMPLSRDR